MTNQSDQQLATHILAHRGGYSLRYVLQQSKLRYLFIVILLCAFCVGAVFAEDNFIWGFCLWGIGMSFGTIIRDIGWLRRIKQQWAFTERILDWSKIEELASGDKTKK